MVYDEITGHIPRRVYVDWDQPGQNVCGIVLNVDISNEPFPNNTKVSVRMDDGTIASFFAPTDLKGKIHPDDVGKYVEITYLGTEQFHSYVHKKFRVLREVAYRKPPKKNGVQRS